LTAHETMSHNLVTFHEHENTVFIKATIERITILLLGIGCDGSTILVVYIYIQVYDFNLIDLYIKHSIWLYLPIYCSYIIDMGRLVKFLFGTFSILVALIAIGISYLKLDNIYRQKCQLNFFFFRKINIFLFISFSRFYE
jgi:hypothetical protein